MKVKGSLPEDGPRTHAGHEIPRIWVVVADREHAHVYRKTPKGLDRFVEAAPGHVKTLAGKEEAHKGHVHASSGAVHYASDPRDREKHHGDTAFVYELAEWLDRTAREDDFDRLVLVAAPRTLGELRKVLSKPVQSRITAEVDKELIKMPVKDLEKELADVAWV